MFRNQYDDDATTWSPQGRLFQVEYAIEAVKLGSCSVAIKGKVFFFFPSFFPFLHRWLACHFDADDYSVDISAQSFQ